MSADPLSTLDRLDDAARAGRLDQALADLPADVRDLARYARVQAHRPLIIGHRGDPTTCVENTLEGIASAFRQGADAVELDVILVRTDHGDGWELVARHDPVPGAVYATIRNLGLEPKVYTDDLFLARPTTPPLWRWSLRRPSHDLPLSTYREHYGYAEVKSWPMSSRRIAAHVPTIGEVGALLARDWPDKVLFLDTKLPPDRPDLWAAMAGRIAELASVHRLEPRRIIVGSADATILGALRDALGRAYRYTHDEMLVGPFAKARHGYSAASKAVAFDCDLGDVGHVFFGSDDELLEVVERDVPEMHRLGKQLIVWTINDELVFRKLLGIGGRHGAGGIDFVITDRPAAFRARLDRLTWL